MRKRCLQVLSKTMDSTTLSPEKVELATLTRNTDTGEVSHMQPWSAHCATQTGLLQDAVLLRTSTGQCPA